jgi:uncharacterized protein DUF4202
MAVWCGVCFNLNSPVSAHAVARQLIDAAHAADPKKVGDRPAELVYADRMEAWLLRLAPASSELLRLAARCQHLERWTVPRNSYPEGRAGYLTWRKLLYGKQAERTRDLLVRAGVSSREAEDAAIWVSKTGLPTNPNTQLLEDAACLVFLENEISTFAAEHADYPREKFIAIVAKTWRKMSPTARDAVASIDLPPAIADIVREAMRTSREHS